LFSLLQLQRSYDSNEFQMLQFTRISSEIRDKSIDEIRPVFDKYMLELLSAARGVQTTDGYSYGLFKDTGIELSKRFKRYFLLVLKNS